MTTDAALAHTDPVVSIGPRAVALARGTQLVLGRDPASDLVLTDQRTSWQHAAISRDGAGSVVVTDLGSTNGTFVDGRPVTAQTLTASSVVQLGALDGVEVLVQLPGSSASVARYETMSFGSGAVLRIGRDDDNDLVLDDPLVSRHHAQARVVGDGFEITDLDSLNGMQLDGVPTPVAHLRPGSTLTIGRSSFQVVDGELVHRVVDGAGLVAHALSFALPNGRLLLDSVAFSAPSHSLVAVIGPSGAGKSTLLKALTGSQPATSGRVVYDSTDLYKNYANLSQRIGVVPQDDVVHRQLTVREALGYAAELRLPGDYTAPAREREVARVMDQLDLTAHAQTRISRLSGGQRKRASVAMELLTEPDLLLLDEPTSGLDPSLDREVMALLRQQADGGRTVLVITHSVANLDMCDAVLILAPGGRVAYYGPPAGVLPHFRADDYADVFVRLRQDPDGVAQAFAASPLALTSSEPAEATTTATEKVARQSWARQLSTCVRRQLRVIASDRSYAVATLLLPLFLALMALAIPGSTGFARPPVKEPGEPSQLLVIMIVGAAFMGMSSSIRELVGERAIFLRERAVGLSPRIYLLAKLLVLVAMTAVQSALLVGVVRLGKRGPLYATLLPDGAMGGTIELFLAVFGTALASAAVGLLLSALVGTSEQTMPVLVTAVMFQLVMCGGLIRVSGRGFMEVLSAIAPARWGYAQGASSIDLRRLNPLIVADRLYEPTSSAWMTSAAALLLLTVLASVGAVIALTRRSATA